MGKILVIAEKPSVAMSIAKILGANSRNDGYTEGNGYIVSWCVGHLVGLAEPEEYGEKFAEKPWKTEHLPIIPEQWKFTVNKNTKKQFDILKKLMNSSDVSEVICATDAGREGECIFGYVYNKSNCKKPYKRLWISSLEEKSIREGFNNLRPGRDFDKLYDAGLCRAKADWLVGMNGTRLFSAIYSSFLSVGRVQTPTLAMIAERDYKVKNFVKEKYFSVKIDCGNFAAVSERIDDLSKAQKIRADCQGKPATVAAVTRAKKSDRPPKLYDLTTLQREANRSFGYTAQQTLDLLQSLYEKKLTTYPRTDSQFITDDMAQSTAQFVEQLFNKFDQNRNFKSRDFDISQTVNNAKVSDHHAILPTLEAANTDLSTLSQNEGNILFVIILKLLCAVGKPYVYETVTAKI